MKLQRLSNEQRVFIVTQIACYTEPPEIAKELYERWGVTVKKETIHRYDPTRQSGHHRLHSRWKELFFRIREDFISEISDKIPEAHKAVRVKMLARAARKAETKGDTPLMADCLERIAKELGGVFTNRREVTGRGGGPIQFEEINQMTDEQIRSELESYYERWQKKLPDERS